jgi:GT2 family glycosyltransferase
MKNITAIIISFLRPGYTKACVQSLRLKYPWIEIIVGENAKHDESLAEVCKLAGAEYVQLPFDSGVCVARNELTKLVKTDYVLVGDDDFFYNESSKVQQMKDFLDNHSEFDLIGGRIIQNDVVRNYQGFIHFKGNHFKSEALDAEKAKYSIDEKSGLRYCPADLTFNYFVGRTEKIRAVPWDEEIKVAYEHYSWFYDFKCAGGKVAFSPDPIVIHKNKKIVSEQTDEYSNFRNRKEDKYRFFNKYGIKYTITMNGQKSFAPDYVAEKKKNDTKYVDFWITTFMRPKSLEALLYSIAKHYPMANVYVADQNEKYDREFYKKLRDNLFRAGLNKRPSIEHLPYDCGLSFARNYLVATTPNKYKLILDDDMVFTEKTDIGKMVKLLEAHPGTGIVGGKVNQLGVDLHFEFNIEIKNKTIYQVPDRQPMREFLGVSFKRTGCVLNFALIKKEVFSYTKWDENLKISEHMDFFVRMKANPYKIIYTPDVIIDHPPAIRENGYKEMRQRQEFTIMMMNKHGVDKIKYLNGQVTELMPDGVSIKRFKELPENF